MINDNRIRIITGHYGSGKTEFTVNYAMALAEKGEKVAVADLDIVNPYFRSREKQAMMEGKGVRVIGNAMNKNIGADLPALSSSVISPLQDSSCNVLLDLGGDDTGAKVLARYKDYFKTGEYEMFFIVNANRPETQDVKGVLAHIKAIEEITGVKVTGLINNTHMLWDTTVDDVRRGKKIIREASWILDIPVRYTCAKKDISDLVSRHVDSKIMPINMYMREDWM